MSHEWSVLMHTPGADPVTAFEFDPDGQAGERCAEVGGFTVRGVFRRCGESLGLTVSAEASVSGAECYLSVRCSGAGAGEIASFLGACSGRSVMRQSPHDPANHGLGGMVKQPVPMGALKFDGGYYFAISDNPAAYENLTTQTFDPAGGYFLVSSGDSGEQRDDEGIDFKPGYHPAGKGTPHVFEVIVSKTRAASLPALRQAVFEAIAARWGDVASPYQALAFATNYMHYRRNEIGSSRYWIVPGIEYANKQYTRDAFWQSMILPLEMEQQIYDAVYEERYKYAENGMLFVIWTERLRRRGGRPDFVRAKDALDFVAGRSKDGCYVAPRTGKGAHAKMLRSWYDICDFEDDDVIAYNQGLLACALLAARELGMDSPLSFEQAAGAYRDLFDEKNGFFTLSRDRRVMCVDALVGDLMASVFFDRKLLCDTTVGRHFDAMNRIARTNVGYKVTCAPDGEYLPPEFYCTSGEIIESYLPHNKGRYSWGGAYFLYDMLALLDAVLHKIEGAEDAVIWRTALEIEAGGTYFENMNTLTGEPGKPNQGWNAAIYALWRIMMEKGIVTDRYLRAIDELIEKRK